MPAVERSGALLRILHAINQDRLGRGQHVLVGSELEFVRALLDVMAVDVGGLLFPMQHQPKLEAGIRDRDIDLTLSSIVDGLCKVGVLVHVKHAPDLIELSL